ncbi:MAG: prolyl oligopeptidase family serine peptidase [bacterium]|nr:prolyl oligopeptidase family serine peptidase [bacterium]
MKITILLTALLLMLTHGVCCGAHNEQHLSTTIQKAIDLDYLLFLPHGYAATTNQSWPMILFLHGSGERGKDLSKVKIYGPPKRAEAETNFPFIVVSPQCPAEQWWDADALYALVQTIIKTYRVDTNRLYLTGLSMGGFGTWNMAMAYPRLFAAIAPVCGGGDAAKAATVRHIPVWVFHGADDPAVPVQRSEQMVAALQQAGGDVRFTRYEKTGHDSWTKAYNDPELYTWFLQHRK